MIEDNHARRSVNQHTNRIRHIFKWAAENQLVEPSVLHGLQAEASLRVGRSHAKESPGVKPEPDAFGKQADQLARQLLASKVAVMAALAGPGYSLQGGQLAEITYVSEEFVPNWEDCPELAGPCPACASLARWWNPLGKSRCLNCDPLTKALRLLERVERIRQLDKPRVDEDLLDDSPLE